MFGIVIRIATGSWKWMEIGAGLAGSVLLAFFAITWRIRYVLTSEDLIIKSATFELIVHLAAIKGVQAVTSFTPAACLSPRRVLVSLYGTERSQFRQ